VRRIQLPTLSKRVARKGYYARAVYEGRITTYQLTQEGEDYLVHELQLRDGDQFDIDTLLRLLGQGWAYTGRSGPGDIDGWSGEFREKMASQEPSGCSPILGGAALGAFVGAFGGVTVVSQMLGWDGDYDTGRQRVLVLVLGVIGAVIGAVCCGRAR
jgi:hypothetical protein